MNIKFKDKFYPVSGDKLVFSYKNLIYETLILYKKNFFLIFFNFLLYYLINEWLTKLVKNYTGIYVVFENFLKSIQSIKKIEELHTINLTLYNDLINHDNFIPYLGLIFLIEFLLFPLLIGIYKICDQFEKNKKVEFTSIFIGYQGNNFFNFIGLIILYTVLKFLFLGLFIFPFILFFILSIFSGPFMLFYKLSIIDSLKLSYKLSKSYFLKVFIFFFLTGLISISGFLICFFGIYITIPIFYVAIYVLFRKLVGLENKQKIIS